MNRDLIIKSSKTEVEIALLEDKRLVELHKEKKETSFSVGDIYFGRVKKVVPNLNAAFVNVGYEKDAFLHYLDLGSKFNTQSKYIKTITNSKNKSKLLSMNELVYEKEIEKTGSISNILSNGQFILVQISKEPISTKGPRLTSEISLAGRYLVLMPFTDKVSISQRIKNPGERHRLRRLVQSIKPKNYGVIIRTVAENQKVAELDVDLRDLVEKWEKCISKLSKISPPNKVYGELNRTSTILRDILNESFNEVYFDELTLYEESKNYINTIAPDKVDIVKLYKGKQPFFEHFGIEKQIIKSFGKTVSMKNGSYLIIEHTEALHVVDVNSGYRMSAEEDQEISAYEVNLDAADEVARQLRLRDMGGIIVIDFIDMSDRDNKKKIYERMKEVMKNDRAKHTVLPVNRFGLVHITRQRVRPEMNIDTLEKCPSCVGTGKVKASIIFEDELEENLTYIIRELNHKCLTVTLHPFIYAFITKGFYPLRLKWAVKFKQWIKFRPMSSYGFLEYHIFDKNEEEIKLK